MKAATWAAVVAGAVAFASSPADAYYVCMYQCNPSGTMLDGKCQRSQCESNPSGICWSGTGSGSFSAESFYIDSLSDCQNYVSAMLQGHTRRRSLQTGGSSGMAANSLRNRNQAWLKGTKSVLQGVVSCATGHRRLERGLNASTAVTAAQAAQIMQVTRRLGSTMDCPEARECSTCCDHDLTKDSQASFFDSCRWDPSDDTCIREYGGSSTISSKSDCPSNAGTGSYKASQFRHCLNQKAASWFVHRCEDAGCAYITSGCSPCCSALSKVLDKTINSWLIDKGDAVLTSVEDEASRFVMNIFN